MSLPHLTFEVVDNPEKMIDIMNHFLVPKKNSFNWSYAFIVKYPELRKEILGVKDPKEIKKKSTAFFQKYFKDNKEKLESQRKLFQDSWDKDGENILKTLSEILEKEWPDSCKEMKAWVSLNPVCPRYIENKSFEVFWNFDELFMKRVAVHEILHFLWFEKWKEVFPKSNPKKDFESPHLIWKLSEIVPLAVLGDKRMQAVFPHEPSVYNEWRKMYVKGKPVLDTIQEIYDNRKNFEDFMIKSYECLKENNFGAKVERILLPKSDVEKQEVLSKIAKKFKSKKEFNQIEVDEILQNLNVEDFILFRRELVNFRYLGRDNIRGTYWLLKTKLSNEEINKIKVRKLK